MSKIEFLLLIPGILYGIGLVDLVKLTFKKHYFEIYLWAFVMISVLVIQWFSLYNNIAVAENSPGIFLVMLIVPLSFAQVCFMLTPDDNSDSREYWDKNKRGFFISVTILIVLNAFLQFLYPESDSRTFARLIILPFILIAAYWDNRIYRMALIAIFLALYGRFFI